MSEDAKRRRSFPEAFKREAVAAIRGGRSVSQVAAELGLADRLGRSWLRLAEEHPAEASGAPAPTPSRAQAAPVRRVGASPADQAAEIARLRKELERARMERDIFYRSDELVTDRLVG
jgi:transposase